tara:strand:+ start:318 stop:1055 length:738 start_codon:yes stop_codon:yes gene_type:complete
MDIIKNIEYDQYYTHDIVESEYTQCSIKQSNNENKNIKQENKKEEKKEIFKTLEELLLFTYDYNSMLQENPKIYIDKRKIELATFIDEHTEKTYDNFNYDKKFSKRVIQQGLQETDSLSSVLYICDLYNIAIVLYDKYNDKYYKLSQKEKPVVYIEYYNHSFRVMEDPTNNFKDINYETSIGGLDNIFNCNVKGIDIYKKYLKAISHYKMEDLIKIAEELNVEVKKNGKRKTKKVLYDDINLLKL